MAANSSVMPTPVETNTSVPSAPFHPIRIRSSPFYNQYSDYYKASACVCSGGVVIYPFGVDMVKATFMDYTSGFGLKTICLMDVPEGVALVDSTSTKPKMIFKSWGQLYRYMQVNIYDCKDYNVDPKVLLED